MLKSLTIIKVLLFAVPQPKIRKNKNSCNVANAKILGSELAKSAAEKGVKDVYLDRGSNLYHGIVKTITDEVRSGGINL